MATTFKLEMGSAMKLRTVKDGKGNARDIMLDWAKLPESIVPMILEVGARTMLTNVFNGGGKEMSETERAAQLEKKLDGWYRGEFRQVERGESQYTAMRDQYAQERLEAAGMSRAEVDKAIRATVTRVFGEKESATFPKFLAAVATEKRKAMVDGGQPEADVPSVIAIAETIETGLAKRTAEAAAKRAKLAAGLSTAGVDLGL